MRLNFIIIIIIIEIISLHQIIGLAPSYLVKHEKLGDLYIDSRQFGVYPIRKIFRTERSQWPCQLV